MHYELVSLHIQIQTAAAYAMLGKHHDARQLLLKALGHAMPDGFLIPFVENYTYIKDVLSSINSIASEPFTDRILSLVLFMNSTVSACPAVITGLRS